MHTERINEGPVVAIHRFVAGAIPVNAYLVETKNGVIVIDSTLAVSDGRALRARVEQTGKPLLGVLVTHVHPDHYGGLTELVAGDDVPIIAAEGVDRIIRRDDPVKEEILRPMFGDEWAGQRTFPNRTVLHGETVEFDGARFTVMDLGPGESPHDSIWELEGNRRRAFVGDLAYNHMHGYFADGHYEEWLQNIERAGNEFPADTVFYVGHGEPASPDLLGWQEGYIRTFLNAVRETNEVDEEAATQSVTRVMKEYLPSDDLLFLMQLSVPAVREKLRTSTL
jgi:glyoxylase-like metal-dependent hydrolase (beta-lactamase superfamily II)